MKTVNVIRLFLVLTGSLLLYACASTVSFNHRVIGEIQEEGSDITNFQYYISDGILLTRVETVRGGEIARGRALITRTRHRDVIRIKARTRGRVMAERWEEQEFDAAGDSDSMQVRRVLEVGFERLRDGTIPVLLFATDWFDGDLVNTPVVGNPDFSRERFFLQMNLSNREWAIYYNDLEYIISLRNGEQLRISNRPSLNIKRRVRQQETRSRRTVRGLRV